MKINIKTLFIALMLLLALIIISATNNINKQKPADESLSNYPENLSVWNATYLVLYNSLEYRNEFNLSHAPVEQFCEENGMRYFLGNIFESWGCFDSNNEKHFYDVYYKEGYWNIGNKSYQAEWD